MTKKIAPCILNCPAHVDIRGYINLIKEKKFVQAIELIMETLPLPGTIARICPHPCQSNCTRKLKDAAINIPQLRIFLSEMQKNFVPQIKNNTGKKVAIIGAGVAGICCTYFLRLSGHDVSIFDAMPKIGGMLRYSIPEYRLPEKVLDCETNFLSAMNVNLFCNTKIDAKKFQELQNNFDALVIATGAWESSKLNCEGSEYFIDGIKFLRNIKLKKENIVENKKIAVIGGGNTALDVCRSAIRLGAKNVINIYRRTRNEMPAEISEINGALEEGIIFKELLTPVKVVFNGQKKILTLQKLKKNLEPENEFLTEEFDLIISAIGQKVNTNFFDGEKNIDGTIKVNDFFQTNYKNIFAIGDAINKGKDRIAIKAIAQAKIVAKHIDNFLANKLLEKPIDYKIIKINGDEKNSNMRLKMQEILPNERKNNFNEIILPWSYDEFLKEAARCLNCGG